MSTEICDKSGADHVKSTILHNTASYHNPMLPYKTHRYLLTIKISFEKYFLPISLFSSLIKGQYKGLKGLLYKRKTLMLNKITIYIRVVAFLPF